MPYIDPKKQERMREPLSFAASYMNVPGDLNFAICQLAVEYILARGLNYARINDVVGAMDGALREFQRRVVGPYEDTKITPETDLFKRLTQDIGQ